MANQKSKQDPTPATRNTPLTPRPTAENQLQERPDKVQLRELPINIDGHNTEFDFDLPHLAVAPTPAANSAPKIPPKPNTKQPLSKAGHRQRLRTRFMQGGADALPDYELLELLLFRAIPRADTKDLAKRLLIQFKTFAEVINAPPQRLKEIPGIGDAVVTELKLVHASALRMMKSQIIDRPILSTWTGVLEYVTAAQGFENREIFRILFLDKKNRLVADEIQGKGTVDHTPVYIREVVKRTLELSATAIILVHNHPSGDPTPSRTDIDMTRLICDAARPLGIKVHDHIIVGRNGHASLKALKLM